jgi:hypothetical protein
MRSEEIEDSFWSTEYGVGVERKAKRMGKVKNTEENFKLCMSGNCSTCPSFSKKAGEGLFCARGASKVAVEKRGCNCPECPVWIENGLSGMYYCTEPDMG